MSPSTPDPTLRYADRLPKKRPSGLRLSTHKHSWYRLDTTDPGPWHWSQRTAMRERFDSEDRIISAGHLDLRLIELTGTVKVLDLRQDRNLDALGLDDQVNTGRAPGVWQACQLLADLIHTWYGDTLGGIVFRSRTTPQHSANLALFEHALPGLTPHDRGALRDQEALLTSCVLSDGFTVEGW